MVLVRIRCDKCLAFIDNLGHAKPKMAVVKTYVVPKRVFPRLDLNRHALATDRAKKLTKSTHTEGNRYFGAYRNGIGLCSEDFFVQLVDKQRADPSKSGESAKTG